MTDIVSQLKHRRKERHITQVKLAELSGVSLSVVKSIESGSKRVSFENLEKVLSVFGLTLSLQEAKN